MPAKNARPRSSLTVAGLTPAPYNPRKITKARLELLGKSMRRFGDLSGIVKNLTTGNLVGGHQRIKHFNQGAMIWYDPTKNVSGPLRALDSVGTVARGYINTPFGRWTYREVRWTPAKEKAANIAANAHGGEFDMQALAPMLKDLQLAGEDLEITGLDLRKIEDLTGVLEQIREADVPEVPKKPITRLGDVWQLGEHRLVCGDATNANDYVNLLGVGRHDLEQVRMIWTDPPWNVALGKHDNPKHKRRAIANDDLPAAEFAVFLTAALGAMTRLLEGDLYCVMSAKEWPAVCAAMAAHSMKWSATIAWVKDVFVLGRGNYHRRMEPIWYGWKAGARSSFCGARDLDDVWEVPRPKASAEHPTMKPTELVARALLNSSKKGDVVLDPFGGAGSLILAAEQTGRRGRSIELDPGYCDVIVKRWETLTGRKALRAGGIIKTRSA